LNPPCKHKIEDNHLALEVEKLGGDHQIQPEKDVAGGRGRKNKVIKGERGRKKRGRKKLRKKKGRLSATSVFGSVAPGRLAQQRVPR
jgi:hypothetical protein